MSAALHPHAEGGALRLEWLVHTWADYERQRRAMLVRPWAERYLGFLDAQVLAIKSDLRREIDRILKESAP